MTTRPQADLSVTINNAAVTSNLSSAEEPNIYEKLRTPPKNTYEEGDLFLANRTLNNEKVGSKFLLTILSNRLRILNNRID